MNEDILRQAAKTMSEYADNKTPQVQYIRWHDINWGRDEWRDIVDVPLWDWSMYNYRIKPAIVESRWENTYLIGFSLLISGTMNIILRQNADGVEIARLLGVGTQQYQRISYSELDNYPMYDRDGKEV
jgi:hypothetical protein